jgi:HPt (histidine-containing phosphotransfer) domain-containing protein
MARRDLTGTVDFVHLEAYAAHDGDVIDEVLAIFREQAAIWIRLLDPAGPEAVWRDGAHTLKGAALGVGAFALADACAEAEAGAALEPGRRAVILSRVQDALDAALADIAAYAHERVLPRVSSENAPNAAGGHELGGMISDS